MSDADDSIKAIANIIDISSEQQKKLMEHSTENVNAIGDIATRLSEANAVINNNELPQEVRVVLKSVIRDIIDTCKKLMDEDEKISHYVQNSHNETINNLVKILEFVSNDSVGDNDVKAE
ncbi:hypothetical protein [Vibrio sp. 2CM40D]|uniref:hypothetical protein n=1 Tax=Vibrio sp. 2CM40D TaxID=2929855 RepID=UPI0020BE6AF3|nr:hypothetical protein [Vibrio sp. 2CM40D]MCK8112430.1 hypothetical protein [Vibrio sp. 2CM40D]